MTTTEIENVDSDSSRGRHVWNKGKSCRAN